MGIIIGSCLHKIVGISSFFWKMMKGIFLTVLAFFVASCQMKKYLIEAESSEDADYEVTTKHHLGDQKCRIWKTRTLKEKCTPGEMYRQWCPEFKKQVADECGEGSDYKDSKPEEGSDYKDSKPEGFCKNGREIVSMLCSGFEKGRQKCDDLEKSLKKECGSGSDYVCVSNPCP